MFTTATMDGSDPLPAQEQQRISSRLLPDEHVLWQAHAGRGLRLRSSDVTAIPVSIVWSGFACYWEYGVTRGEAPWFFKLWGDPFICVALYMMIGRFFYDAWQRRQTLYAVTNQRVLILRSERGSDMTSLVISGLQHLELQEQKDGSGSIVLGNRRSVKAFSRELPLRHRSPDEPPAIEFVAHVRHVHDLIQSVQLAVIAGQPLHAAPD